MSPGGSAESNQKDPRPLRAGFAFELEQLRLQVEVMALRVDAALQHSTAVLLTGDRDLADGVIEGDDEIDDMLVSLTERCHDLLGRQNPMASDLRLVVSVIRILGDLERTGDLCLRIVKLAPDHALIKGNIETFEILGEMAAEAQELFRTAHTAWSTRDLRLAKSLELRDDAMDSHNRALMEGIMTMKGANAVPTAVKTLLAGRALERIADHAVMIGERLRYMLTGNSESLSAEIRPTRRGTGDAAHG
ncbi:MAG: phosphate signaling complex protein PhoU [Actinomycetota bacterium]